MKELFSKEKWSYFGYTLTHPMDGFYWIRHKEYGSVPIAILMVILFSVSFSLNRLYASFVVNETDPRSVNSLTELAGVLILFMLICIGNWSITCLMDGEGRFKDIIIAVGYGISPATVGFTLATLISKVIADNEQAFYSLIIAVCVAYAVILILMGIMQVHNYTLGKTLITLFLTFIAVFIIIFLALLLFNLIGQVITFFKSIYLELIFR
ncbi:MAG: Yip1 family protein [Lachnospiraceae bacterium]